MGRGLVVLGWGREQVNPTPEIVQFFVVRIAEASGSGLGSRERVVAAVTERPLTTIFIW